MFADDVLMQAGLACADVNGITMNAVRPLITAVQEGRANTSQMVFLCLLPICLFVSYTQRNEHK